MSRPHPGAQGLRAGMASCHALLLGLAMAADPLPPSEALRSIRLADDSLIVELVAAEPLVLSPVSLAWDHRGRLFVAEMRDYPSAASGGAIRLLEDRDGDGRMDASVVFAEGLAFPTSVFPWRDGVLVMAAPDILFLRDANGDGKADERHVLFTGLGVGNQQLRANSLSWGHDGWIYAANGRSDGALRPVEAWHEGTWTPHAAPAQPLRGRDFRFNPSSGDLETLAGRSQFGLGMDEWGNRFLSWNTIPARHEVFPDSFLERNPSTAGANVLVDVLPQGDPGDIHPASPPPRVFNNESAAHFNALSGLHLFRGSALGPGYQGNIFVGESLRNLVHRRVLVPDDVTFQAVRRDPPGREFLASTDPWFHPVAFSTGPDGALYVADFYREFVEHPDWVSKDMRAQVDWTRGHPHGRIWRVRNPHLPRREGRSFAGTPPSEWVRRMDSPEPWERDTAHRLLLEKRDPTTPPLLHRIARESAIPEARARALRAAQQLGPLPQDALLHASRDPHPRVREQAARAIGIEILNTPAGPRADAASQRPLWQALGKMVRDTDSRVMLAAALALGSVPSQPHREAALEELAGSTTNAWLQLAAASSSSLPRADWIPRPAPAPRAAPPSRPTPAVTSQRQAVIDSFQQALALTGDPTRGAQIVQQRCLACHLLQGHGQRIGPDLASVAGKDPGALLTEILDPSRQVAPDYVAYEVTTRDHRPWQGLIASETATRITLRFPGSPDMSIPKASILNLRSTGRSLMPDGLESDLTPRDMAGLLAFLRAPDPRWFKP